MRAVHKYPITIRGEFDIETSTVRGQHPVLVEEQAREPFFWLDEAMADAKDGKRTFRVYGTGHDIGTGDIWMGTWVSFPFVWHLYEVER